MPDISGLSALIYLYISYNDQVKSSNATVFSSMTRLNALFMACTGVSNVPYFPAMNLRYLYLGRNKISSLQPRSFQALKSLLRLDLKYNLLSTLPDLGGIEANIRYLNLTSNRFRLFPDVSAYSNLQKLDLSDNFITSVPEASLAHMRVVYVNLTGNPIVCVTEPCWLVSKQWPFTACLTCPGGTPLVNMGQDAICQGRWTCCRPFKTVQATGLDAWASRVKCPARFVSYLHDICIYMSCL